MNPHFRKFLAASQFVGGMAVVALPVILSAQGHSVAWWYWILLAGFGGLTMAAGVWLWRDQPRGRDWSALIQALQIVQFRTSTLGITILAGFQLRLLVSDTEFTVGPAFHGAAGVTVGQAMPWFISINFFAAYAVYALLRSRRAHEVVAAPPGDTGLAMFNRGD
jgi:hypothetical protein